MEIVFGKHPETDPFAEFTELGWALVGKQVVSGTFAEKQFFVRSSKDKFEQMCSLEALCIKDEKSEATDFRQRYNDQIVLTKDGFYEAPLSWKSDRLPLPDNKELALGRLQSSTKSLEKIGKLEEYQQIMKEQLNAGIIEPVPKFPTGRWCTIFRINLLTRNQQNQPSFESCMIAQYETAKLRRH